MDIVLITLVFIIALLLAAVGGLFYVIGGVGEIVGTLFFRHNLSKGIQPHHIAWVLSGLCAVSGVVLIVLKASGNM